MNTNRECRSGKRALALVAGMILVGLMGSAWAQEDFVISNFDTEDDAFRWSRWWGGAPQTYEYDPAVDAGASATSGALKATVDFDLGAYGGDNQFAVRGDFAGGATVDGTKYTNLVFELRWKAGSPTTSAGHYGNLEYGLGPSDWSQIQLGALQVPLTAAEGWVRVVARIDPATPKLESIARVWLKIWSGGTGGLTGQTVFWVDNVKLVALKETGPPPAPALTLQRATSGLRIAASAPGAQYQRQNIRTLGADPNFIQNLYSWVHNGAPVTYALSVKAYPGGANSGFQAQVFLVPEYGMRYGPGDTSIDWNAAHVIFLHLANTASGAATAAFRYKTNLPGGNAMLWNANPANGPVGQLATLSDPSPLGTWSLTFKNNTEITLTAPSGTSTNFAMPEEAALLFADPLYAYVGIQPNQPGNIGQAAIFSRFQIAGAVTPLDDTFSGETLDLTKWAVTAADPAGVVLVPPTTAYWLRWAAPATGFVPEQSPSMAPGSWVDAGAANVFQIGTEKAVLIPVAGLPSPGQGFFRLVKP
ncbi:MAG: hypothetical protein FJ387_31215 [Verrucomicrobia bacterium]|nr:hypothetical protein [Verrucomicrobiota bacterium]